ncbi:hypothetical protein pipiens_000491, partial [Culex pipiens pipiens]
MRSKYNTLAEEASTEKAARLLLEDRVKALEVHNDSHSSIEVEDQVTHSEFNSLREQNAALQATVEELSKTIAELAAAKPASTPAVLDSEVYALREQNQALSAEVAALRETTVTPPACESQSGAQSPLSSELAKAQQEILNLREELKGLKEEKAKWESGPKPGKSDKTGKDKGKNNGKNQQSQKPKQAKGGVQDADPKPTVPITPSGSKEVGTSPNGESQGGNPGDESSDGHANDGFTVVNRRKPRSKHKPRTRNEAIAIKADEKSYASLLRNLRSNEESKELGEATKSVRRTRQNELLLILKRGTKPSSEYARLVTESVGSDEIKVRSPCSETTLQLRQAEELWKEMRSKYNTLAEEASTEKAARLLLEDRVKALEVHNDSHSSIEVEDQVTHSEFNSLREQNAALQATVEELSKTIAELAAAKPASTPAALDSEVYALRKQNQALSAEVAALRETTVTPPACESQPGAQSPLSSELAKAQQEILNLREELKGLKEEKAKWESGPKPGKSDKTGKDKGKNNGKNQQSQKPKQAKGGVQDADPKPTVPITPSGSKEVGTSPDGESQGGNPGDESSDGNDNEGFKVVNRRKPRSKHKPRTRNEAIAIKADEKSYASLLRNLRSNEEIKELGEATKSVRRTRQNELLLILKRGTKPSSEYARLVTESVGSDEIKVRSLCTETTLQSSLDFCCGFRGTVSSTPVAQHYTHIKIAHNLWKLEAHLSLVNHQEEEDYPGSSSMTTSGVPTANEVMAMAKLWHC